MDTRNPQLQQAMTMLETYERESKIPRGFPPGTEFKTLSGPGVIVLGSSLDAGREVKAAEAARFATYENEARAYKVRKLLKEVKALLGQ